jgi:hypothetical protein
MFEILLNGEVVGLVEANSMLEAVRLYRASSIIPGFYTARRVQSFNDAWNNAA